MEPGGIEPAPIQALQTLKAEMEHVRATQRAVQGDPVLSQLVQAWPTLPHESRELIAVILQQHLNARSDCDCTEAAGSPSARGPAATDGDSGEVQS